ncbi:putative copper transporter crmD [Aspergillus brunneoviolaceus CBS 621.78]|uniref:Uncharacterized protein n=1 Tax=Aspergillus brunneoviolaceus CBS 621.78 TaxID=1450534 RepID=A0ACD1GKY7_9EURO|nr:hypothetical protein BO95DRAFT_404910 [Aspergillus brunneoviolaceus CBS 621.78]RAH49995.1 hypothetical protein BO95DRAFT_404910 [Aspergillus brunneoviolaceus CBS 621.78]
MNVSESEHHEGMAMSAIFRGGTQITLFSSALSTQSVGAYLAALVALCLLAWFNRFLAALRYQIEATQPLSSGSSRFPLQSFPTAEEWDDGSANSAPSAGLIPGHEKSHESNDRLLPRLVCPFPTWAASRPWRWRIDGLNTLLEGIRSLTGYLLMLAVMTFNLGVLAAIVAGVMVGELTLGRFSHSAQSAWQDGACHDD